jgi:hypothetical protein
LSTHALGAAEEGGLSALRFLDVAVLAIALPIFIAADLPLAGWGAAAGAWGAQRAIQIGVERRARATNDPRTVAGLLAGSMIARAWIVAGAVFAVGVLDEKEAGLSAAVLAIACFTAYFSGALIARPFDVEPRE